MLGILMELSAMILLVIIDALLLRITKINIIYDIANDSLIMLEYSRE